MSALLLIEDNPDDEALTPRALRRVRAQTRTAHLPVVILTSSDEEQDLVRGYELGANSFVRKPVDFEQFAAAFKTLGLYWLVINQLPRGR